MHESEKWKWSCSVVSDPQWPHRLQPSRLLRPWDFPGRSTGVGCHCLLFRTLSAPPNLVSATNTRCLFSTLSCGSLIKYLYKSFPINIFFWFPDCLGVLNWVHILILSKNYTWLSELFADLWKKKNHDLLPNRKKYRCLATAQFLQDNQNWIYSKCRRESNVLWKQKLGLNIWNFLWGLCSHFVSRLAFLLVIAKQRKITVW